MKDDQHQYPPSPLPITSRNSGTYHPAPYGQNDVPTAELSDVQAESLDLAIEEFSEGPYGAAHNETKLGKVSEWKTGQAFSGRFRDSNLIESDRKVATEEKPSHAPRGSIEGQS